MTAAQLLPSHGRSAPWAFSSRPPARANLTSITTDDGTVIVRDAATGRTASGRTLPEAMAELRRLLEGAS